MPRVAKSSDTEALLERQRRKIRIKFWKGERETDELEITSHSGTSSASPLDASSSPSMCAPFGIQRKLGDEKWGEEYFQVGKEVEISEKTPHHKLWKSKEKNYALLQGERVKRPGSFGSFLKTTFKLRNTEGKVSIENAKNGSAVFPVLDNETTNAPIAAKAVSSNVADAREVSRIITLQDNSFASSVSFLEEASDYYFADEGKSLSVPVKEQNEGNAQSADDSCQFFDYACPMFRYGSYCESMESTSSGSVISETGDEYLQSSTVQKEITSRLWKSRCDDEKTLTVCEGDSYTSTESRNAEMQDVDDIFNRCYDENEKIEYTVDRTINTTHGSRSQTSPEYRASSREKLKGSQRWKSRFDEEKTLDLSNNETYRTLDITEYRNADDKQPDQTESFCQVLDCLHCGPTIPSFLSSSPSKSQDATDEDNETYDDYFDNILTMKNTLDDPIMTMNEDTNKLEKTNTGGDNPGIDGITSKTTDYTDDESHNAIWRGESASDTPAAETSTDLSPFQPEVTDSRRNARGKDIESISSSLIHSQSHCSPAGSLPRKSIVPQSNDDNQASRTLAEANKLCQQPVAKAAPVRQNRASGWSRRFHGDYTVPADAATRGRTAARAIPAAAAQQKQWLNTIQGALQEEHASDNAESVTVQSRQQAAQVSLLRLMAVDAAKPRTVLPARISRRGQTSLE